MPSGMRRTRLERCLQFDLSLRFEKRVVQINEEIAAAWGKLVSETAGRPITVMDAFLAATARVHDFTFVTRNAGHFPMLRSILSPWS